MRVLVEQLPVADQGTLSLRVWTKMIKMRILDCLSRARLRTMTFNSIMMTMKALSMDSLDITASNGTTSIITNGIIRTHGITITEEMPIIEKQRTFENIIIVKMLIK